MTEGNKHGRYIGVTDEPLCKEGRNQLSDFVYDKPQILFISPMKRCQETADILFPGMERVTIQDLSECDFGEFENKNYKELSDNDNYQKWIDSNGTLPFPGGESPEEFKERSICAFKNIVEICLNEGIRHAAIVAHGGTIMSVMEAFSPDKKDYYEWHVKNGCGYCVTMDERNGKINYYKSI